MTQFPGARDSDLDAGLRAQQAGDVAGAVAAYRRALARNPRNAQAHLLMGSLALEQRQPQPALEHLRQAVALEDRNPAAHANLGHALMAVGDREAALESFRRAVKRAPGHPQALTDLAGAYRALGRLERAADTLRKALKAAPGHVAALHDLALVERSRGRLPQALKHLQAALEQHPSDLRLLTTLGEMQLAAGDNAAATASAQRALDVHPAHPLALDLMARCLARAGRHDDAVALLQRALEAAPHEPRLLGHLGAELAQLRRFAEAEARLEAALAAMPDAPGTLAALAFVYQETGRAEAAVNAVEWALRLDPNHVPSLLRRAELARDADDLNLAVESARAAVAQAPEQAGALGALAAALADLDEIEEALSVAERALAVDPELSQGHAVMTNLLLASGRFGEAWPHHARRTTGAGGGTHRPAPPLRPWRGEPLAGETLFLYGEQGPGDILFYVTCLPDLARRAAAEGGRVVLSVEPRLVALLGRSFPAFDVVSDEGWPPPPADATCAMAIGDLPSLFRVTGADFPPRLDYVTPDPAAVERWRDRYRELGPGPAIGISWRGGATAVEKARRGLTLTDWAETIGRPAVRDAGVVWINLQYGDRTAELDAFAADTGLAVADWPEAVSDLDDFAAQVAALDLTISITNTTVHFAGAQDRPVWVLTPARPHWAWLRAREDNPWYPSLRHFRQAPDEAWGDVLVRVGAALDAWLAER